MASGQHGGTIRAGLYVAAAILAALLVGTAEAVPLRDPINLGTRCRLNWRPAKDAYVYGWGQGPEQFEIDNTLKGSCPSDYCTLGSAGGGGDPHIRWDCPDPVCTPKTAMESFSPEEQEAIGFAIHTGKHHRDLIPSLAEPGPVLVSACKCEGADAIKAKACEILDTVQNFIVNTFGYDEYMPGTYNGKTGDYIYECFAEAREIIC